MKKRYLFIVAVLALTLVLPASTFFVSSDPEVLSPYVPMSNAGKLEAAFVSWSERHVANGGDSNVSMSLRWSKGLSMEYTEATGRAKLDLIGGTAEVELENLGDADIAEVWLVDNAENSSVLPESEDQFLHVGTLERDGDRASLSADLGNVFGTFEVDLVVVSRAGQDPTESRVLTGSSGLMQRMFTRARTGRLASAGSENGALMAALDSLGTQSAFASGLVPSFDPLIEDGAELFFNETFAGNGRTCGTCHPSTNNFTIDPDFIATLPDDDPLFVAEFVPALANNFEKPELMRKVGLIVENLDGFGDLANNFTMRGVPHTLALGIALTPSPADGTTTPPDERTGWSGDGSPGSGTLREFAIGAVTQHFPQTLGRVPGVDFVLPTDAELDAMEAFQLFLGRQSELDLSVLSLNNEVAARGQEIFLAGDTVGGTVAAGKCNICHANAGANFLPTGGVNNRNFNTGAEAIADQPADLIDPANNPPDGGFGQAPNPSGGFGDGTFNTPVLVEAADTGPFFHNNSVETIEGSVAFYNSDAFANSPSGQLLASIDSGGIGIDLEATQVVAIGAFLRTINALENNRTSSETATFVKDVDDFSTARSLLEIAISDVEDGIQVLDGGGINPRAVRDLKAAKVSLEIASVTFFPFLRDLLIDVAVDFITDADADIAA
ncbi:MAG: hypothetical protein AAF657_29645 [Acidobacteriota bacterium]